MKYFTTILMLLSTLAYSQNKSKLESYMDAQARLIIFREQY